MKHSDKKIVIGLCTFFRNDLLDGALESLSRIALPDSVKIEFVLIDNDKNGGAQTIFDYYKDIFPFESHYFIEPNQGIVHARNRVLEESLKLEATEIAFFDDDEILSEQWLVSLWNFYSRSFFGGVGGPMYRLLPRNTDKILMKFWKNTCSHETGDMFFISTNNCLFSADLVHPNKMNLRFDEFFNQIGGEDSKFAIDAVKKGVSFAFVKEALSVERFTEERATFLYLLKRHFGGGNLTPLILYRAFSKRKISTLVSNLGKFAIHTILIPISIFCGKFTFWRNLVKAAQSTGAIFGWLGFSYKFYTGKTFLKSKDDTN